MAITAEEIAREKKRLPRGWGRFGKSLDRLAELSEPKESLVSSCVGLNPNFHYSIPYGGLEVVSRAAKEFVLGWPAGQVRIRGAAKQQVPQFLDALSAHARPSGTAAES